MTKTRGDVDLLWEKAKAHGIRMSRYLGVTNAREMNRVECSVSSELGSGCCLGYTLDAPDCLRIPTSLMKVRRTNYLKSMTDMPGWWVVCLSVFACAGCKVSARLTLDADPNSHPHLAISPDLRRRRRWLTSSLSSSLERDALLPLPSQATNPTSTCPIYVKAFLVAIMADPSPPSDIQPASTPSQAQAPNEQPGTTKAPPNQTPGHPSFRRYRRFEPSYHFVTH